MEGLGERLVALRKRAGLTQEELGGQLSPPVNANSVGNWERGKHSPSGKRLPSLARVLEATVDYLVGEEGGVLTPLPPSPEGRGGMAKRRTYDPDEPPIPPGLQTLIDIGLPLGRGEVARLLGYADPLNPTRGASGAMGWTPGDWLMVLLEERRRGPE